MGQAFWQRWRRPTAREWRWLAYLLVVAGIAAWRFLPRPWHPTSTVHAPHHLIYSTADSAQTADTARTLELLFLAYSNRFGGLKDFEHHPAELKVKLYGERAEMRQINPWLGWAEAYYRAPYCHAYFAGNEINPYHWMLHEAVHQLNHEVAHLQLEKWLNEGLAEYFSTSRIISNRLAVGMVDLNTYPVWWMETIATSPYLTENLKNGSVIPLRAIITDRGGPAMRSQFNLYYLHWWTLTHFIFESPQYRDRALTLVERGGGLEAFEEIIGPVDKAQAEWHAYVRRLKSAIASGDVGFFKSGQLPERTNTAPTH